jgi:N-acylneuraminate cytidylyltransferase
MVRIVVIIPARSGSKSLINKNILPLHGKPLLCYSVEYALRSKSVDKVVVSTDSELIARIAKECGAETPFLRPNNYSQDNTRDYPVMKHALEFFDGLDEIYDIYVLLRPTSPVRPSGLIERAIKILEISTPLDFNSAAIFSVVPTGEVDSKIIKSPGLIKFAIDSVAESTYSILGL